VNWYKQIKFAYRIEDNGNVGTLVASPNDRSLFARFEFQTDDSFCDIMLNPLSPEFGGMVYPSASYIAITTSGQISNETEKQIISQLMDQMSGVQEPKWDMGTNPMMDVINKATGKTYTDDPDEVNMTEIPETEVLPLPSGIQVKTNPTLKIIRCEPGNARYAIDNILRNLEQIIQPFLENNLIDYYAIDSSSYGKKFVRSGKYQQVFDESQDKTKLEIGYLKHVVGIVLEKYPHLKKTYTEWLNKWHPDVDPQSNMKVDLRQSDAVQELTSSSGIYRTVMNAIIDFDENQLAQMEHLYSLAEQKQIDVNSLERLMYWLNDENVQKMLDSITDGEWMYFSPSFLEKDTVEFMRELGFGYDRKIDLIQYTVENAIPKLIQEQNTYVIKQNVIPIYKELNLSPEVVAILEDFQKELRKQEFAKKQQQEEQSRKSTFVLNWDAAFMHLNDVKKFTSVPDYYLDHGGDVTIRQFVVEKPELFPWYDHENAWYDAASKAEEELRAEIPDRPSDLYGQDRKDVIGDIKIDADDFVADVVPDQAEEFYEKFGNDKDKLAELVIRNMYQNFVEWMKESMRKEEGEYWEELDNSELQQKARDIQENDVNEDEAFTEGLFIAHNKPDHLSIWVDSKYIADVKEILKEMRKMNKDTDDDEDYGYSLSLSWPVEIYFTDQNETERKSLYEWIG